MSTNHTPNYSLSLWEASDQVTRTEFNENHAKLDAALAGKAASSAVAALAGSKADSSALAALAQTVAALPTQADLEAIRAAIPKVAAGTYRGDGSASRLIDVGFTPKAVLLMDPYSRTMIETATVSHVGGLAVTGGARICSGNTVFSIETNGFRVGNSAPYENNQPFTNSSTLTYYYLAIG